MIHDPDPVEQYSDTPLGVLLMTIESLLPASSNLLSEETRAHLEKLSRIATDDANVDTMIMSVPVPRLRSLWIDEYCQRSHLVVSGFNLMIAALSVGAAEECLRIAEVWEKSELVISSSGALVMMSAWANGCKSENADVLLDLARKIVAPLVSKEKSAMLALNPSIKSDNVHALAAVLKVIETLTPSHEIDTSIKSAFLSSVLQCKPACCRYLLDHPIAQTEVASDPKRYPRMVIEERLTKGPAMFNGSTDEDVLGMIKLLASHPTTAEGLHSGFADLESELEDDMGFATKVREVLLASTTAPAPRSYSRPGRL